MFDWRDYGNGIYAFDAGYIRPILAAIHFVVDGGRVAVIDTGSNDSLPNVLAALQRLGLDESAVDYVMLTHIHLDHAGGAGRMMRLFPNAKLVVHPRGAKHMAEPSKLVAGVCAVYGEEYVARVYGDILPIAEERIISAGDGCILQLGNRQFECFDTPGHARHHLCILDRSSRGLFTGDTFGLSYRELDVGGRPFIFPTTTPSQFEPAEMRKSIARLLALKPEAVYLTHYARLDGVELLARELLRRLDELVAMAESCANDTGRHELLKCRVADYLLAEVRAHGCSLPDETVLAIWDTDIELNTQGLEVWLDNRKNV